MPRLNCLPSYFFGFLQSVELALIIFPAGVEKNMLVFGLVPT